MRDLVVREALETMARHASKRLRELVAQGEDLPYDVQEAEGGSALPQYIPLTGRFIRDHSEALLALDSFGAACAAIESANLAAPYLDCFGIDDPGEPRRRGELASLVFLCRLWEESTDFSLDGRLDSAIAEIETGGEIAADEIEVIVPLRGLQLPVTRLELATATIVRADTVDVPAEARAPEGSGAAGWEPTFLGATCVSGSDGEDHRSLDAGARAVEAFRQLVTTLRLFKSGGVGLGPYAWTRIGQHRWRRIATGAGRPRPGGYRLSEEQLGELVVFSRTLAYRSTAFGQPNKERSGVAGALARATSRFEAGLERAAVIDALNDYLLALRFVLEGGGAAQLGLAIRVAALCAEPEQRGATKAVVDRAIALERELWSGEPAPAGKGAITPAETAAAVEDLTRAILRDAACGHLGADLRGTADEILLADGLALGEGRGEQRGGEEEWDVAPDGAASQETREMSLDEVKEALGAGSEEEDPGDSGTPSSSREGSWMDLPTQWEGPARDEAPEPMKVPEPGGRIRVESYPYVEEETVIESQTGPRDAPRAATIGEARGTYTARVAELLAERPSERPDTSERVAYLFPRPETTEWNVRELSYDRRRRARIRAT